MLASIPPRYRDAKKIGEGANSSVYSAYDTQKNIPVALKIADPRLAQHRRFRTRWKQEVAILRRFAGKYVVPLYDSSW